MGAFVSERLPSNLLMSMINCMWSIACFESMRMSDLSCDMPIY